MTIYKKIAKSFPNLKTELIQAGIDEKPEDFLKKSIFSSVIISAVLCFVAVLVLLRLGFNAAIAVLFLPIFFLGLFMFLVRSVKSKSIKTANEIDKDIIYLGRFLIIQLNSGVSLYDAMKTASFTYTGTGKPLRAIIDKVNIGKPIDQALSEVIELTSSLNLKKVLWQIMNSLRTGGDVSKALAAIINQLSREQIISVKAYSRKLNALVMFYLMIAIVAPSLGITILSLVSIFMSITMSLANLMAVAFFVFLIQIMFLSMIKSSRPGVVI
jgi:flagellar protein FlaJ